MKTCTRSRLLAALLVLVMVITLLPTAAFAAETGSVTATWTKVDLAEIQPTDTIAITMTAEGTTYVLYNGNGTNSAPTAMVGTVDGDTLTTDNSDSLAWNIVSDTDGYIIYKAGSTESWLYSTSTNNGVRVGTNENKIWVLDSDSGYLMHVGTSRYLGVYLTAPDWRAYTNTTGNTKNQTLAFYKLSSVTEGPEGPEVETVPIATALAGETGTAFTVQGVVTLIDGKNVYVQDATGGIDLYLSAIPTDLQLGDTVIGTGKRASYYGLPELTSATYEKASGLTLSAKETSIGALTTADVCTYVKLTNLKVTEVYDKNGEYSAPNITVTDGKDSIQIYKAVVTKNEDGTWPYAVGDVIDVTAAVGIYNATFQLRNTTPDEISRVQYAKLAEELTEDDQFVIYYNKDSLVMTDTVSGKALAGEAVTLEHDFLKVTDAMAVLDFTVDEDGYYTFTNEATSL